MKTMPLEVMVSGTILAVTFILAFWGRVVLSEEHRIANSRRFKEWMQSNRTSAKIARVVWWFLTICAALHALLQSCSLRKELSNRQDSEAQTEVTNVID